jgi:hypothetical protein
MARKGAKGKKPQRIYYNFAPYFPLRLCVKQKQLDEASSKLIKETKHNHPRNNRETNTDQSTDQ